MECSVWTAVVYAGWPGSRGHRWTIMPQYIKQLVIARSILKVLAPKVSRDSACMGGLFGVLMGKGANQATNHR